METLAADPERGLALILINIDRGLGDPDSLRREPGAHDQVRLQGWRLVRVPSAWLGASQGGELIELVLRS